MSPMLSGVHNDQNDLATVAKLKGFKLVFVTADTRPGMRTVLGCGFVTILWSLCGVHAVV
jgi:hypothetical protein